MATIASYGISRDAVEYALSEEGLTLEDFSSTIFGLIHDGEAWSVYEDSLEPDAALEWANQAADYGEVVGLYVWDGGE